jgi:AraC family transcriptional regulator of adaptative response / DNA-3-methyladenine glycosylase II
MPDNGVMELDSDACYRAVRTRDGRFDGRFFTGVKSTGIYCRPVCPAPTPHQKHCVFFSCAAAAQEAGFRPCLRCRPEVSPDTPAWNGSSSTVSRALRLISEGALDDNSVDTLAARVGVGERHLRRLFTEHLGASPVTVAGTQRVLFAKKLLLETALPITDIAFAAGFASVRRFNHVMRDTYQRSPRELRGRSATAITALTLTLPFRPPYNWTALTRFLALRAIPGVEVVTPEKYTRTIRIDNVAGRIEVTPVAHANHLAARIELQNLRPLARVSDRLRRLFDTGAPVQDIESHLRKDPLLAPLVKAQPGLRVPGAWDPFELAIRAILGQQVTVKGASTLAGRLVEKYGEDTAYGRLFPSADALARADLSSAGLPRTRANSIRAMAEAFSSAAPPQTIEDLLKLPGIGHWTGQYIAMRAFNEPDAFPSCDLGLVKAAGPDVAAKAEAWRPWRAYAAMHLWMNL